MSTILALVKTKLWPAQGNMYKQEVIDRVITFAQALFTRHANCAHLGPLGMGCFQTNQVRVIALSVMLTVDRLFADSHRTGSDFDTRSAISPFVDAWV